jgi:hypothetical protein
VTVYSCSAFHIMASRDISHFLGSSLGYRDVQMPSVGWVLVSLLLPPRNSRSVTVRPAGSSSGLPARPVAVSIPVPTIQ